MNVTQAVPGRGLGRGYRRRLWFGLLTVLGVARRGFFIPHRYAAGVARAGRRPPYDAAEALFARHRDRFREVLAWIDGYADDLSRIGGEAAPAPRWDQAWFPRLDAAAAYTLVRRFRPRRIVEVGSGHSTRFLARAIGDGGLATRIVAVDPAPRAKMPGPGVEWRRQTVQQAGEAVFAGLGPGDMVSIDSSHILMPGSDVDTVLGRILPGLAAGVLVHVHDIFLPDDYPAAWDWRGYNEQLGFLPLLLGGPWEVLFASWYVTTRMAGPLAESCVGRLPLRDGALESSLWMRAR